MKWQVVCVVVTVIVEVNRDRPQASRVELAPNKLCDRVSAHIPTRCLRTKQTRTERKSQQPPPCPTSQTTTSVRSPSPSRVAKDI